MNFGNFKGAAKRIEDIDLPRIGREISVGEDEIHAVLDVESSGSGFDAQGRPKILFEPHVFYRNLSSSKRTEAVAAGLAYSRWGTKPYPKDSYPRLIKAMAIDETVALKACSWGLGQILGENHKAAGYATPQAMVLDFMADEDNHLEAMIRFIKANKLDDNLRAHDWAGFAKGYNGDGYASHNYHGRLAAAYAKWKRIKDTPYTTEDVRKSAAQETETHNDKQATKAAAKPAGAAVVLGGGAVVATAASGRGIGTIILVFAAAVIVAAVVFFIVKSQKKEALPS